MLNISPVPHRPKLSEETRHKLLASSLGVEHEREWRWQAVCAVGIAGFVVFLAWEWVK